LFPRLFRRVWFPPYTEGEWVFVFPCSPDSLKENKMTEKKTFIITIEPMLFYIDAESEEDAEEEFDEQKPFLLDYDNLVIAKIEEQASTTYISDKPPTLTEAYDIIGCRTVELIQCEGGSQILIDEEGKLMDREHWKVNKRATQHWILTNTDGVGGGYIDVIVGNAIILSDKAVWT